MLQHNVSIDEMSKKENKIDGIFSMLDKAIDDLENGKTISEEEMWAKLAEVGAGK